MCSNAARSALRMRSAIRMRMPLRIRSTSVIDVKRMYRCAKMYRPIVTAKSERSRPLAASLRAFSAALLMIARRPALVSPAKTINAPISKSKRFEPWRSSRTRGSDVRRFSIECVAGAPIGV